jgi:phosphatidylinositol-4,5-bisphosphate 3-kinase
MLEQSESDLWMVRNEYVLKYHLYGNVYELFDDLQLLQTLKIYPEWLMDRKQSGQVFIVKKKKKTDKDKHCDLDIGYTMGMDLRELSLTSDPELAWTRRVLVSVCEEAVQKRNPQQYAMETDVLSIPPPSHVCKKCPDNNVDLNFFFGPDAAHSSKICFKFDINEKADKIVEEIYIHYSSQGLALGSLDEWTLKVCGYEDYVWGNHSILTFRYVQLCLIKDLPISLTLVKKLDFTIDQLPDVSRVDLVDDNSYLGGTHEQLTATNKNPDDTFIMSMWDINHMFSIKVVGIDGLEIPNIQSKSNSNHELKVGNVFVEAAIYHGGVSLTSNLSSHQQPFKRNVYFKEWLKSNIKVRNIPMAARLCLVVKGFVKNHPVPLYWVNVQLLDHRAVLRCGLIKLPLWPVMEWDSLLNAKEEIVDSGMRPSGSATLNPSPKSPILYIELYSYAHPVACPHSGNPCGDSSALSNPEKKGPPKGSLMERMLLDIIESDALTKLDDQQRDLVETYRHHLCRHYPDALPKYLLAVKWSDLHSVLEVQDLLEKWKQPISLKVSGVICELRSKGTLSRSRVFGYSSY